MKRFQFSLFILTLAFTLAGCRHRPSFAVGDHLIPLGSSDPTQIVTVAGVEKDSYQVALGITVGPNVPVQTRARKEIDSYYVRVADLPVGGSWATPTPSPSPTPTATPPPQATSARQAPTAAPTSPPLDAAKTSAAVRPALLRIMTFDSADKPRKQATGFMISADGRFVTTARVLDGAAKGVVELPSGAIKNVTGILASSTEANLAVAKADVSGAPFLPVNTSPQIAAGEEVAIVESSSKHHAEQVSVGTVANVRAEPGGEVLQVNGEKLDATAGAPVVSAQGDVVAFVTADENGATVSSVRSAAALRTLLAEIQPNATPSWPGLASQSPTASPSPTATPKPRQSPPLDNAALVYTPYPRYPAAARFSYFGPQSGTGTFLIKFSSDGAAESVQIIKSTGSQLLDQAAVDALKYWRAQRGHPTQKIVPITFRKP